MLHSLHNKQSFLLVQFLKSSNSVRDVDPILQIRISGSLKTLHEVEKMMKFF